MAENEKKALIEHAVELESTQSMSVAHPSCFGIEVDVDYYRSVNLWRPTGARGVFGGQVVGQSLMAASKTVSLEYTVHSLHSYFLLPGNPDHPILYRVNRVRDGTRFHRHA